MTDTAFAKWTAAFVKAQAEMPPIHKSKTATIKMNQGGSFSYSYADLPDIIDSVRPVLSKHGLAVAQSPERFDGGIGLFTRIYHEAGHVEIFGPVVLPSGGDARAAGSAITYARRYGLCAALNIAADEDDDGAQVSARSERSEPKASASSPEVSPVTWGEEEKEGSPAGKGPGPSTSSRWKELRDRYGKAVVLKMARDTALDLKEGYIPAQDSDLENCSDRVYDATTHILAEKHGHAA